jgi:hypothetical protein
MENRVQTILLHPFLSGEYLPKKKHNYFSPHPKKKATTKQ